MAIPRSRLIKDDVEVMVHCFSRCVRRAFLCGYDRQTNRNYEHRRAWLRDRLKELSRIFFIDVCSYAVMENHLHVVLRNRPSLSCDASDEEIAYRWWYLFPKRRNFLNQAEEPTRADLNGILGSPARIQELRQRLSSISWFMRCLKENIAKRANVEDQCTGRFWEGRFKSTTLLDKAAILACIAYVDLNPIRAGLAETPETSDFTSIQDRIISRQAKKKLEQTKNVKDGDLESLIHEIKLQSKRDKWLCPFRDEGNRKGFLDIDTDRYFEIVDWTGRHLKKGKNGRIPLHLAPILTRLEVNEKVWLYSCQHFNSLFFRVAGKVSNIHKAAAAAGQKWLKGQEGGRTVFLAA